jgi:CDP-diacylglycerol--glycerol-3-phosphate 3-phosphatidyltransferase
MSHQANGFLGSRGISGRIPEGYTLLEQRFMAAAKSANRLNSSGVELREWARQGWTYHAKGIWVQPAPSEGTHNDPVLTLLGSTNLSTRSVELDAELSFAVLSAHPSARAQLTNEMRGLWTHAEPWKGQRRHVRMGTRAIVGVVGGML